MITTPYILASGVSGVGFRVCSKTGVDPNYDHYTRHPNPFTLNLFPSPSNYFLSLFAGAFPFGAGEAEAGGGSGAAPGGNPSCICC